MPVFCRCQRYTVWQESFKDWHLEKTTTGQNGKTSIFYLIYTSPASTHCWVRSANWSRAWAKSEIGIAFRSRVTAFWIANTSSNWWLSGESWSARIKSNQPGPNPANMAGGAAWWHSFWLKTAEWGGRYARAHYRATGTRPWTCANSVTRMRSVSAVGQAHVCRSPRSPFAPEEQTQYGSCRVNQKSNQHRLHVQFLPPQFLWSRRTLACPFRTLSFSSWFVRKTPWFVPHHNCGRKCRVVAMHHEKVFARGHMVCFLLCC